MPRSKQSLVVFVAHSFSSVDRALVSIILRMINRAGVIVLTGERPEAKAVGQKIKRRIDSADLFIGILTRRHKLGDGQSLRSQPILTPADIFG